MHIALIRCRDETHKAITIGPAIYKHVNEQRRIT
jgi:hypothetical protein